MINKLDPRYGKVTQQNVQLNPANKSPLAKYVRMTLVGKKKAGRMLDGRTWDGMPEVKREAKEQAG